MRSMLRIRNGIAGVRAIASSHRWSQRMRIYNESTRQFVPSPLIVCGLQPASLTRGYATAVPGFQCSDCGQQYAKWQGQCSSCSTWGTIGPAKASAPLYRQSNAASFSKTKTPQRVAWAGESTTGVTPVFRMKDVEMDTSAERIELPDRELNWVLGGGIVAGSLTLVAGNPGVGKSTLALQIANMVAQTSSASGLRRVLYVSGEESVLQIKMRAERLGAVSDELFVGSETNIDTILQMIETTNGHGDGGRHQGALAFDTVVIDSIQTIYADDIASPAGTVNQVKECTLRLLRLAKQRNIPVLLIGHVTKSGDIAGPKVLEHIVDTVVQLEGDPQSSRRFLRCQKNRFGNTSEVGVFTMTDEGLQPLVNPLLAFVSDTVEIDEETGELATHSIDGSSVTIAMEGSRPIPLEIQALANRTQFASSDGKGSSGGFSRVRGNGVAYDKLQLLFAVLEKRGKVSFYNRNVFVNVAEGYTIQEPAADLAVAVALASAVTGRPVLQRAMFLGELSLSGHLRPVKMLESRLTAAHKIGLEICVIPKGHDDDTQRAKRKFADKLQIVEASTLLQALHVALQVVAIASDDDEVDDHETPVSEDAHHHHT